MPSELKNRTILVPVFGGCRQENGATTPIKNMQSITVLSGIVEEAQLEFDRIYELEKVQCDDRKIEAVAASPEWWQSRPGNDRPQLLLQFSEQKADGSFSPPMYQITIPHYSGSQLVEPPISPYQGGNYQGSLTLTDSSKIIVNANSSSEAERTLIEAVSLVSPALRGENQFKIGKMGGKGVAEKRLVCRMAKYFANGQRNLKPEWISYFYDS